MTTHFITAEIDITEDPLMVKQVIETELKKQGEPLRWSITEVNSDTKKVKVEAVVTSN